MATILTCDVCQRQVPNLQDFGQLETNFQIPGRVVYVCARCSKDIDKRVKSISRYYTQLLATDVREYILEIAKPPKDLSTA